MSMSVITFENQPIMKFRSLTELKLSGCQLVKQVPDMSGAPNLRKLHLDYCNNLVQVHDSVGFLENLEEFNINRCTHLRILPRGIHLKSLKNLSLRKCTSLNSFPEILGEMENIKCIRLSDSAIRELPSSIGKLTGLRCLFVERCKGLMEPSSILVLPKLNGLRAEYCQGYGFKLTFHHCLHCSQRNKH